MSLIEARNLTVRHGEAAVLSGVNLSVARGEILTVVGPNGSGKSTLVRALIGAVRAAEGSVLRAPGLVVGYVPQRLHIDATLPLTVRRFLSLPRRVPDAAAAAALARADVETLAGRRMSALSGGQFQRVLLARALLAGTAGEGFGRHVRRVLAGGTPAPAALRAPDILILDEPTQGLDQPGIAGFYRLLEEVRRETGAAVLLVSHDLHVVMSASDRVICLNGHICCEGAPHVVSAAPEYRALFGLGTGGALALYRHEHDHDHAHVHDPHAHGESRHGHDHAACVAGGGDA